MIEGYVLEFIQSIIELLIERFPFFLKSIGEHLYLSFIAIFISSFLGLVIGITCTRNPWIEKFVMGFVNLVYTIPVIAMLGMLIPLVGIGTANAIITLSLYALLPMVRNTLVGIRQVDKDVYQAALGMGTTDLQMLFRIELPLAFPIIFAGFRNMVVMTIALAGIASMIGAGGLGRAVWRGITTSFDEMIFLSSFLIALLAGIADFSLGIMEKIINKKFFGIQKKAKLVVGLDFEKENL